MKHAYLIMIHDDFYVFEKLIQLLDYEENDLYIHVCKKVKKFDFKKYKELVKKAGIYFTKRINVKWGDYSQIKCELLLLESATKNNTYQYYHLLSGVDLPLKSQKEIHEFFNKSDYEYVAFNKQFDLDRVLYYHFFTSNLKINCLRTKIHYKLVFYQKKFNIKRNENIKFQKGANWFSITDTLARYILSKKEFIKKVFKYTYCADEMFLQTIIYNSPFINKVYNLNDEYDSIKRCIDWNRGSPYIFRMDDFDMLINSNRFFARKFSSLVDKKIIDKIYEELRFKND